MMDGPTAQLQKPNSFSLSRWHVFIPSVIIHAWSNLLSNLKFKHCTQPCFQITTQHTTPE